MLSPRQLLQSYQYFYEKPLLIPTICLIITLIALLKQNEILKEVFIPSKTHDKAIQKARESCRLTKNQKAELNALKIKNTER